MLVDTNSGAPEIDTDRTHTALVKEFIEKGIVRLDQPEAVGIYLLKNTIFDSLHHSSVALVDLTGLRPNCFMELGYALGNRQRVIVAARDDTKISFDAFALEAFQWKDGEDPTHQLDRFRTHWERNINMPKLVRPKEAK